MDTGKEQGLLTLSIAVTLATGALGVVIGVASRSQSILFDGIYAGVDVAMTVLALLVSRLLASEGSRRFQFGYWHLEPLVTAANGVVLALACLYAFLTALGSVLEGGRHVEFGSAALYAFLTSVVDLALGVYVGRQARRLDSDLLRTDARACLIGGALSGALLVSFIVGAALERGGRADLTPYVDPLVLMLLALAMIPAPLGGVRRSLREVFQVAPEALDTRVRAVMDDVVARHGLGRYTSYVAKVGRARFIEIAALVPHGYRVEQADAVRREIAERLGGPPHGGQWLTVMLTAEDEWL